MKYKIFVNKELVFAGDDIKEVLDIAEELTKNNKYYLFVDTQLDFKRAIIDKIDFSELCDMY